MTYGELYYFSYNDFLGRKTTVKILQDEFAGTATELNTVGADPIKINTKSTKDYLFDQIYGSECEINLISETNFQFIGLFSANAFKNKVEIWKELEPDETQTLFWAGFLLPDEYSEPIDYTNNYEVTLVARDGLGALKNIDFLQDTETPYVGKQQIVKVIAEILKKLKLNININFSINLIENNTPEGITDDTMERIFIDYGLFYLDETKDCDYVLSQILQSLGARIIQANGEWNIERIPMYVSSQNIHKYDYNGNYISSTLTSNQITYTGKYNQTNNRLFFIEKKGNLTINPAYKEFVINHDFGKKTSIISNNSFEQFTADGMSGWSINSYSANQNWEVIERVNIGMSHIDSDKYCLHTYPTFTGDNNFFKITSSSIKIKLNSSKGIKISFEGWAKQRQGKIIIKIGNKYLADVNDENTLNDLYGNPVDTECKLIDTPTSIWWGTGRTNQMDTYNLTFIPSVELEEYFNITFLLPDLPSGGGNANFGEYWIDNVNADFIDQSESLSYPEDANYEITVDENNNYIPNEIDSILGDLPGLTDAEDIYLGGYFYFDGTDFIPTSSWSFYGSSRELSLMPLLAEAIQDQYRTPKHKISGTLKGNFVFNKCIFIEMMNNKLYYPIRMDYSDKYNTCDIEAIELVPDTESDGGIVWGTEDLDYVVEQTDILIKV